MRADDAFGEALSVRSALQPSVLAFTRRMREQRALQRSVSGHAEGQGGRTPPSADCQVRSSPWEGVMADQREGGKV